MFCVEQIGEREMAEPCSVEMDMPAALPLAQPRYCHQSPAHTAPRLLHAVLPLLSLIPLLFIFDTVLLYFGGKETKDYTV